MTMMMNVGLLSLFCIQHTVMARPAFKQWWTVFVPKSIERSTYVLISDLLMILVFYYWQPMPVELWSFEGTFMAPVMVGIFWLGWAVLVLSSFLIDHFDLFGIKQVLYNFQKRELPRHRFQVKAFYKIIRHPLMAGWILIFWGTPVMTHGHLLFAVGAGNNFCGVRTPKADGSGQQAAQGGAQ